MEFEEVAIKDGQNNVSKNINDNDNVIEEPDEVSEDMSEDAAKIVEYVVMQKAQRKPKNVFEKVVSIFMSKKKGKRSDVNNEKLSQKRKCEALGRINCCVD